MKSKNIIIGMVIAAVLIIAIVFFVVKGNSGTTTKEASVPTTTPVTNPSIDSGPSADSTSSPQAISSASTYKDGTYSATGSYISPGGTQQITVSLTLKDDIVTDATVTKGAIDPTSSHHQDLFIAAYKPLVIGKNIADVNITKVSGSSLTPQGFDDAVVKIEAEAKA